MCFGPPCSLYFLIIACQFFLFHFISPLQLEFLAPTGPPPIFCRSDDQHVCRDGSCIDSARLCDGTSDCPQGDDEEGCGNNQPQYQ